MGQPLDRKAIFKLLIPVTIDQLFLILLPMANTIIVSKLGQTSMSGVSVITQVNQMVALTVVMIGFGAAIMVAQYTGRGDREAVRRVVQQAYSSSIMVSAAVTALMLIFADSVVGLALTGAEPDMLVAAKNYLLITCLSYPFYCFYSATAQMLRGIGQPRKSMVVSVAMNLSSFLISLGLIYGLKMGISGAALATLLGRVLGTVVGVVMVRKSGLVTNLKDFFTPRLNWKIQSTMLRMGVPAGAQSFFFIGARLVMNVMILKSGTIHMAASVVFTQLLDIQCTGSTIVVGMAPAILGMAKGRNDQNGIKQAFKDLSFFAFWFGAVFAVLPLPFLTQLCNLYHLSAEAAVIAKATVLWNPVYIITLVWFAQAAPAAFRGIGDTLIPPIIVVVCVWVGRVGTVALLTGITSMGAYALFWGLVVDYVLRFALYGWRYKSGAWLRAQKSVD